ncbi:MULTISPECIES: hypothetical protein [Pseudomonas]|uniref:hypothetical protein n=1 Tax=Pseudomonas TaxID=286 RepID=UPI00026E4355|nr:MULTISPECIES: hypothetical protein [Pseudomonas]EJL06743.1 hypothetical protein Pchl3084_3811 [Pseudomonas chlororaphis subsp. aureofaciens 30-84]PMY34163.1 hypothetical protein C1Y35_24890 [Pseudomonas sp. GW456-L14]PMY52999.1 hypothetical protein C1Y34_20685 [Pseudomonas sp. GW456-L12]PXX57958.1 hypothetical protein H160_05132 [Pseudomonas sp. LAMO17WK12:I9]WDG52409.1 hypothetical protein PUP76_21400 [Pseudomonas chlororaphis]
MCGKRYLVEFTLVLLAYLVAVVLSTYLLPGMDSSAGRIAVSLIPVIPMIAMALVVIRQLRRLDELSQRIQLNALGIAFVCTALITFSYGFLEIAGLPRLSMFAVWPIMGSVWLVATLLGNRRYQ